MSTGEKLSDIGESASIARLVALLQIGKDVKTGAGDDCAVVNISASDTYDILLTSDPVIEGVHFTNSCAPADIGHKAVGRALSDIAAMGGNPRWCQMNITATPDTEIDALEKIYSGALELCDRFGVSIVGGDTSRGESLQIHSFVVGVIDSGKSVLRSGAEEGNLIYVTGQLGGSAQGKHLSFLPRLQEGTFLRDWATAMIDITDGLASDLRHIIDASDKGASIESAKILLAPEASDIKSALYDGEDFELLFTINAADKDAFEDIWRKELQLECTCIGVITDNKGVIELKDDTGNIAVVEDSGYDHFR